MKHLDFKKISIIVLMLSVLTLTYLATSCSEIKNVTPEAVEEVMSRKDDISLEEAEAILGVHGRTSIYQSSVGSFWWKMTDGRYFYWNQAPELTMSVSEVIPQEVTKEKEEAREIILKISISAAVIVVCVTGIVIHKKKKSKA